MWRSSKLACVVGLTRLAVDPDADSGAVSDAEAGVFFARCFRTTDCGGRYEYSAASVTTEYWTAANNVASPLVTMEHIYDYANGHIYSYVDTNGLVGCKIEARDDVAPTVQFPDKNEVNLLQTILPTYDILKNASYLGIHEVHGMPVHVFELEDDYILDTAVDHRNLPVQVTMLAYGVNNKPYFYFYANIHDITTMVTDLNEKLSVKDCYDENDSEYTWVQLGFPEQDKVAVVPLSWLTEDRAQCHCPPKRRRVRVEELVRDRVDPTAAWQKYPVCLVARCSKCHLPKSRVRPGEALNCIKRWLPGSGDCCGGRKRRFREAFVVEQPDDPHSQSGDYRLLAAAGFLPSHSG
ncbi:hypothetical protein MRX96_048423 [Rhipicephalus microplus]